MTGRNGTVEKRSEKRFISSSDLGARETLGSRKERELGLGTNFMSAVLPIVSAVLPMKTKNRYGGRKSTSTSTTFPTPSLTFCLLRLGITDTKKEPVFRDVC